MERGKGKEGGRKNISWGHFQRLEAWKRMKKHFMILWLLKLFERFRITLKKVRIFKVSLKYENIVVMKNVESAEETVQKFHSKCIEFAENL